MNSNIISKAFYLMVQGGVHPKSQIKVPALVPTSFDESIKAAAKIFYDANTKCFTEGTNFLAARACTLLFASSSQIESVTKAWDAVGVSPPKCSSKQARCTRRSQCCGQLTCDGTSTSTRSCKICRKARTQCKRSSQCCSGLTCKNRRCA